MRNVSGTISSIFILTRTKEDILYIVDRENHRILESDLKGGMAEIILGRSDGSSGSDTQSFDHPNDIYVSSSTFKRYVVDTFNHRILVFEPNSKEGSIIFGTGQPVIESIETTGLNQPMSITMDNNQTLYIADYGNNRIVSFNLQNNQVNSYLNGSIDSNIDRHEYVLTPISIKYSFKSDSFVIGQEKGFNVIRWKKGEKRWTLIAGSASSQLNGTSRTLFNEVCSINVDEYDNTYVNDCQNNRIQFYRGDLTKGKTIAGVIQAPGNNSYLFNGSTSIALDSNKNLYVADSNNTRIQKFIQLF